MGKFINSDIPEYCLLSLNAIGHNLLAYCTNNPVNLTDSNGNIAFVDDAAIWTFIGLCAILLLLVSLISTPQFQRAWNDFCLAAYNGLSWITTGIVNGGKAAWNWTRNQIKLATAAVTAFITIVQADTKIKTKVKRNSKQRYWSATILKLSNYTYVSISSAISYSQAKLRVKNGLCVFTVTKTEARHLASNFPPIVGPEIGSKNEGQYMHYHVQGRKNKSHIFFLF